MAGNGRSCPCKGAFDHHGNRTGEIRKGVLTPLEPLDLEEGAEVTVVMAVTEEEAAAIEQSLGLVDPTDAEEDAAMARATEAAKGEGYVSEDVVMETLRAPLTFPHAHGERR